MYGGMYINLFKILYFTQKKIDLQKIIKLKFIFFHYLKINHSKLYITSDMLILSLKLL